MFDSGINILAVGFVTWSFVGAGILATSIPIIIHILNRRRFKIVTWAAMEFLLRAMRKNRRRLRFEQWVLLATRCLLVLLLGMALARPLGCENQSMALVGAARSGMSVFVIDNSYSMAYEVNRPGGKTHLENAKRVAKELVDRAARDGGIAVVVASNPPRAIVQSPSYDPQAVKDAIDRIEQSYSGTDIPGALQLALQIAKESERQPDKSLHLFTDSTASAWRSPQQGESLKQLGPEVAKVFHVTHHNLSDGQPQSNAAIASVRPRSNLVTNRFPADFTATPRGYGSVPDAAIRWTLGEQPLGSEAASVKLTPESPDVQQANVRFPGGGPQVVTASIAGADRLRVDDSRYRVVDVASELGVLIVEGRQGTRPQDASGMFLQTALSPPHGAGPPGVVKTRSYLAAEVVSVIEFGNKVLDKYAVIMLADVGQIAPQQAEQLERFVKRGGTLFWFMGEQVNARNYNEVLLPRKLIPGPLVKLARVGANEKGYLFEFNPKQMPYLREFENQENTGLETIDTQAYWQVDIPQDGSVDTVLRYQLSKAAGSTTAPSASATAKQTAGDVAVTVHGLGDGKVVFCSTTANAEWTTFPKSIAHVPVMHELVSSTVRTGDYWLNLNVGQPLVIPPAVRLTATPTLTDPAGRPVEVRASSAEGAANVYRTDPLRRPGVYALQLGTRQVPVAVNVPPEEADVRTVPDAAVREALGGIELSSLGAELPPDAALNDTGRDLSWVFMLLVLGLLGVECIMAMRFGHYRRVGPVPTEAAPAQGTA